MREIKCRNAASVLIVLVTLISFESRSSTCNAALEQESPSLTESEAVESLAKFLVRIQTSRKPSEKPLLAKEYKAQLSNFSEKVNKDLRASVDLRAKQLLGLAAKEEEVKEQVQKAQIHQILTWQRRRAFESGDHKKDIITLEAIDNQQILVWNRSEKILSVLSRITGKHERSWSIQEVNSIYAAATAAPDRKSAVIVSDKELVRVDLATGTEKKVPLVEKIVRPFGVWSPIASSPAKLSVEIAKFSPDGKYLVITSRDKFMEVRKADDLSYVFRSKSDADNQQSEIHFSPDGRFAVSHARGGKPKVIDLLNQADVQLSLPAVGDTAFAPTGRLVILEHGSGALREFDLVDKKEVATAVQASAQSLRFTPDGKKLVLFKSEIKDHDENSIRILDLSSGAETKVTDLKGLKNSFVVLAPKSGSAMAIGEYNGAFYNGFLRWLILDTESGLLTWAKEGEPERTTNSLITPDGDALIFHQDDKFFEYN